MTKALTKYFVIAVVLTGAGISYAQEVVDIDSVTLDKDRIVEVCRIGRRSHSGVCGDLQAMVKVSAKVHGTKMDGRLIYYVPSSGKIVGSGTEVIWDLTEVIPGSYTISVGIGAEDVIEGKVITKGIVVRECDDDCWSCSCPTLSIEGPTSAVRAGGAFIVRARVSGGDKLTYKWTISAGTVVGDANGQNILVKTTKHDAGKDITISLELGGTDPACNCPTMDSMTVQIQKR